MAAWCPRCNRWRLVIGASSKKRPARIRQHITSTDRGPRVVTPCPGSGTPVRAADLRPLEQLTKGARA